jgi:hypothetical protein
VQGEIGEALKRELIHGYYASTSFVDAQIGKVLNAVNRLGLADDTIIVLWGDHGFHLGDLGIWTKHTNYEQANRIPILIVAPGVTRPGSATKQLAESVDIYPTLAELAGLPKPKGPQSIDGVSLVPTLKEASTRVRGHAFHAYPKGKLGRAIRTERYRLVEWRNPDEPVTAAQYELYDYQTDPLETRNHAAARPEIVERLAQTLATYPKAKNRSRKKRSKNTKSAAVIDTPVIAKKTLKIVAEIDAKTAVPNGVVLAQGGREHGYALHFIAGRAIFDVRVNGKVTRIAGKKQLQRTVRLEAALDREHMKLMVNDEVVGSIPSPGLIPVQPKDDLSVGLDSESAAGNYTAPNPFNGTITLTRVDAIR